VFKLWTVFRRYMLRLSVLSIVISRGKNVHYFVTPVVFSDAKKKKNSKIAGDVEGIPFKQ